MRLGQCRTSHKSIIQNHTKWPCVFWSTLLYARTPSGLNRRWLTSLLESLLTLCSLHANFCLSCWTLGIESTTSGSGFCRANVVVVVGRNTSSSTLLLWALCRCFKSPPPSNACALPTPPGGDRTPTDDLFVLGSDSRLIQNNLHVASRLVYTQGGIYSDPRGLIPPWSYAKPLNYIHSKGRFIGGGVHQDCTIRQAAAMNQNTVSIIITNLWQLMTIRSSAVAERSRTRWFVSHWSISTLVLIILWTM